MSKNEFLLEMKQRLQKLPLDEREQALVYYEEYFNEAGPENEARVLRELQSPAAVAAGIIGECAVRASGNPEKKARFTGLALLAVCAAPLALPLAAGMLALLISLYAVFLSLGVAAAALVVAGAASVITGALTASASLATGIFYVGYGLLLCAAGIPSAGGIWRLSQATWRHMQLWLGKSLMKKGGK